MCDPAYASVLACIPLCTSLPPSSGHIAADSYSEGSPQTQTPTENKSTQDPMADSTWQLSMCGLHWVNNNKKGVRYCWQNLKNSETFWVGEPGGIAAHNWIPTLPSLLLEVSWSICAIESSTAFRYPQSGLLATEENIIADDVEHISLPACTGQCYYLGYTSWCIPQGITAFLGSMASRGSQDAWAVLHNMIYNIPLGWGLWWCGGRDTFALSTEHLDWWRSQCLWLSFHFLYFSPGTFIGWIDKSDKMLGVIKGRVWKKTLCFSFFSVQV